MDFTAGFFALESDYHALLGDNIIKVLELDYAGIYRFGKADLVHRLVAGQRHQREAPGHVTSLVECLEEYLLVLGKLQVGTELLVKCVKSVGRVYEINPEKAFDSFERDAVTVSHLLTKFQNTLRIYEIFANFGYAFVR